MKTAVIYARYSSDKQTEQSIEGQLYDCYNYAKQHGITVVQEYIDRAMTGKNDDRPAFQQMLHESAMHKWDSVIVWKLDRFARNTIDSAVNRQILAKNGVKLLSVMESFGDDASGQMMTHIIEAINEYYSADLREKTIRGMRQSAMKAQTTGHIPLGYKVVDKKLVIDDETRIIPETVFRMYAEGERLTDIASHLNSQGYRNRRGRPFTTNSFYNMLANEKYIGIYKYDDIVIEGGIPQMIPNEVFEAVREKLITNRKRAAKNTAKADYYLSGKLYCGHCGEPMSGLSGTGRNGVKHYYYRCNGVQKKSGCHKKLENKDEYQTVYAKFKGSAAAPTAGLHFTPELLEKMKDKGAELLFVTLHVGIGTFRPVAEENIEDHEMHREWYTIEKETAQKVNEAKEEGRRIIAVGTTSVRTLESAGQTGRVEAGSSWTQLYIYPGYQWQVVDAIVTNFHLPESTLIMMMASFAGREHILAAYEEAVRQKYRFFSFGDAMFLR